MAGILNPKERVLDFVLTEEGKKQLPFGKLEFEYATYTDLHTFYEGTDGIANEASGRVMLAAYSRQQDRITPTTFEDGRLQPFGVGDLSFISDGPFTIITSGSITSVGTSTAASDPVYFDALVQGSIDNFADNRVLGESDEFSTNESFETVPSDVGFRVARRPDDPRPRLGRADITAYEAFFTDRRFSDKLNYQYLAPRAADGRNAFNFTLPDPRTTAGEDPSKVDREGPIESLTRSPQAREVNINGPTLGPDMIAQVFEKADNGAITKLSTVSIGRTTNGAGETVELFQAGKVIVDEVGLDRFVAIFTFGFVRSRDDV